MNVAHNASGTSTTTANDLDTGKVARTVRGVNLTIDFTTLNDVDVLYQIRDIQHGDTFAALDVLDLLLGEDQRKKLVDTIRDPQTGRANINDFGELLKEIFDHFPKS